jgi:hypothetical protein
MSSFSRSIEGFYKQLHLGLFVVHFFRYMGLRSLHTFRFSAIKVDCFEEGDYELLTSLKFRLTKSKIRMINFSSIGNANSSF